MKSQDIDKASAIMAFTAASKYRPRLGSAGMRSGATSRARIPNPMIIRPHWVTKTMS